MRNSENLIKLTSSLARNSGVKDYLAFAIILVTIYKRLDLSQINDLVHGWTKQNINSQKALFEIILKDIKQKKICPNLKSKLEQIILA
ncbi:hypothetical protein OAP83_00130 [Rickettsiales bacterium]|nr:hypothetical protein [Rickettsiales bacterium]